MKTLCISRTVAVSPASLTRKLWQWISNTWSTILILMHIRETWISRIIMCWDTQATTVFLKHLKNVLNWELTKHTRSKQNSNILYIALYPVCLENWHNTDFFCCVLNSGKPRLGLHFELGCSPWVKSWKFSWPLLGLNPQGWLAQLEATGYMCHWNIRSPK